MFGIDFSDMDFDDSCGINGLDNIEPSIDISRDTDILQSSWCDPTNDMTSPSFTGHIDDLYDPEINTHRENYLHELEDASNSTNTDDILRHTQNAKSELHSIDYWEQCKKEAQLDADKSAAFIDGINKQWEIADKYSKEIEEIFNRGKKS